MKKIIVLILAVLSGVIFSQNSQNTLAVTNNDAKFIFPQNNWEYQESDPMQFSIFNRTLPFVINKMNTTGLMVIRHGKVLFEFGDIEELSYIASCRKSVLAMLYGKYVENGKINLNRTLEEIGIDDIGGLQSIEKKATIRDLITARSGIYHPAANDGDNLAYAPARGSQQPGTYFLYNNWDFNAAGAAFEKLTGKTIFDALEEDLAIPIGMQDFKKDRQKMLGNSTKSNHLAYHMWFSTRDMARLGYLMLREGDWNGKQVVSKNWIKEITKIYTPRMEMNPSREREGDFSYGYMWWIYDNPRLSKAFEGAYSAQGAYGQYILVVPKLDLVIAHKTKADYMRSTSNFKQLSEQIVNEIFESDNQNMTELKKNELELFDKYVGSYKNPITGQILKVSRESDQLFLETKRRGKCKLNLAQKNIYYRPDEVSLSIKFNFSEDNKVKGFTFALSDFIEDYSKVE